MPKLKNPRYEAFAQEYVANGGRATDAYRKVASVRGAASPTSVDKEPWRLMQVPAVKARVNELQDRRTERLIERTVDHRARIVEEMAALAFSNTGDFFEWLDDGRLKIKGSQQIPLSSMAAIKRVSVDKDGNPVLTFYDKAAALHELANLYGMFQLPVAPGAGVQVNINMGGDQLTLDQAPQADVMNTALPAAAQLEHQPTNTNQTPSSKDGWLTKYAGPPKSEG